MENLDALVRSTMRHMHFPFDTHDFIIKLAHHNQREYVRLLYEADSDTPFQKLHGQIGKRLKALAEEFGLVGVEASSPDIFRQHNSCVEWSER